MTESTSPPKATTTNSKRRDLIVVGASAGGIEALKSVLVGLPTSFPAAIAIALHVPPYVKSALPQILSRVTKLPVAHAEHREPIQIGRIYIARPDHHLLIHGREFRLSRGPRISNHRPAIDALFLSAAQWAGPRTVAVLLSGLLDDGTHGILAVRNRGGTTIAQDPDDALFAPMPSNAIEQVGVDHIAPANEIGRLLQTLAGTEVLPNLLDNNNHGEGEMSGREKEEEEEEEEEEAKETEGEDVEESLKIDPSFSAAVTGPASGYTCPDCHGALWEIQTGALIRYRCRVGHAYGAESLLAAMSEQVEDAVWAGYRALEESAALAKRLGDRARERGFYDVADRYKEKYAEAIKRAKTLRAALERGQLGAEGEDDERQRQQGHPTEANAPPSREEGIE